MTIDDFVEFQTANPGGEYEILYRDCNTVVLKTFDMCIQYWQKVSVHVHTVHSCIDVFSYEDYLAEKSETT